MHLSCRVLVRTVQPLPRPRAGRPYTRARKGRVLPRAQGVTGAPGLTALSMEELERLLRALESGRVRCPLDEAELERVRITPVERAGLLLGHSEAATRALLAATLAERTMATRRA